MTNVLHVCLLDCSNYRRFATPIFLMRAFSSLDCLIMSWNSFVSVLSTFTRYVEYATIAYGSNMNCASVFASHNGANHLANGFVQELDGFLLKKNLGCLQTFNVFIVAG